jgi:hypothetical protein
MEVAPDVLVRRKRQPRDADQTIRPCGGDVAGAAQFAPVFGEALDVRDLICGVCREEPFEPGGPRSLVRRRSDDLGEGFLQTSNRWLRLPPECVTPESYCSWAREGACEDASALF